MFCFVLVKAAKLSFMKPQKRKDGVFKMTQYPGLTQRQAQQNRVDYGDNLLENSRKKNPIKIFLSQFRDLMTLILLCSTGISLMMGEKVEAVTIIAIVMLNALLGFFQEYRTERSLEKLNELAAPTASVIRDGKEQTIPAREVTIGDLVLLKTGDRVPADCRIVENSALMVDESLLTGESVPVEKAYTDYRTNDTSDQVCAFMGTIVTRGHGKAIVHAIGEDTRMGQIAVMLDSIEEEQTPLQQKLDQLGKMIAAGCLLICAVVAGVGILRGEPVLDMLITGISLAVAAIPEGLPAIVTIALALSVNRMVKKNAVIRRLHAVETLGCANVICSDKTGTLTENRMTVKKICCAGQQFTVTGNGLESGKIEQNSRQIRIEENPDLKRSLEIAVVCNNARIEGGANRRGKGLFSKSYAVNGEPTEAALAVLGAKGGVEFSSSGITVLKEIPFDSQRKMMSVVVKNKNGEMFLFTKGAPDILLQRCAFCQKNGEVSVMSPMQKQKILSENESMAKDAMRVLALCWRRANSTSDCSEQNLVFCGLCGMIDPPRKEAFDAVEKCRTAQIRPVMITGDSRETACAIASQLKILRPGGEVLTGAEIERMDDESFLQKLPKVSVFARVTPAHKLRIVKGLKSQGNIVAMTGDGVNDAPAVKEANIGVSMGKNGTDVTKEASAVILMDDNFATLVSAIEEGRVIYRNIRKFIRYLLSCNIGEVVTMFLAMLMGMPVPLLPIQILLINLVTDGLPAIALGLDPPDSDVMNQKPRKSTDSIFSGGLLSVILFRGMLIGLTTIAAFSLLLTSPAIPEAIRLETARTGALVTLILTQLIHVFECKSENKTLFGIPFFNNWKLIAAVCTSLMVMGFAVWHPMGRMIFETTALNTEQMKLIGVLLMIAPLLWSVVSGMMFSKRKEEVINSQSNPSKSKPKSRQKQAVSRSI